MTEVSHFKLCQEIEFRILSKLFRPTWLSWSWYLLCDSAFLRIMISPWFQCEVSAVLLRWITWVSKNKQVNETNPWEPQTSRISKVWKHQSCHSSSHVPHVPRSDEWRKSPFEGPWLAPLPWLDPKWKEVFGIKKSSNMEQFEMTRILPTSFPSSREAFCHPRMKHLVLCFGHLWRRYLKCMRLWPRLLAKMTAK